MTGTAHTSDWHRREPTFGRKVLIGVLVGCAAIVLYLILQALLPRWWAHRVGKVVDGSLAVGAIYGLFIGFLFTLIPLVVAWIGIRTRSDGRTWRGWLVWFGIVVLAASPNLVTLHIVVNNTKTSSGQAGDRTLDTLAPGFRLWSVIGAFVAVALVIGVWYLARSRRASRRQASEYRDELRARDEPT